MTKRRDGDEDSPAVIGNPVARMRRDAAAIFDAAVQAVDPLNLVYRSLPDLLPDGAHHVRIIAAGKAAAPMAAAARGTLGPHAADCIVVAPHGSFVAESAHDAETLLIGAGHPLPDAGSIAAGHAVLERLAEPGETDLLLVLISGGASSLLCAPAGSISLDAYRDLTALLLASGAAIAEINCVRRHIDTLKGGGLARAAGGVPIVALMISDVVGNAPGTIASGPLSGDAANFTDALAILERYSLVDRVPAAVLRHLEDGVAGMAVRPLTPDAHELRNVRIEVIADNRTACEAAVTHAIALGYAAEYRAEPLTGEAAAAGESLSAWLRRMPHGITGTAGSCCVAGGETTVALRDCSNPGGRNQELALSAALGIDGTDDCVLLSGGTDGVDGATDAAGGIVDGNTVFRIRTRGIDPATALREHDSHRALRAAGDLLITGPTGTNVMDIQIALRAR